MRRRLFVHIGMEKTGTSTLQRFLEANSAGLAAQGFCYLDDPKASYFGRSSHGPVAAALVQQPDFVALRNLRVLARVLADLRGDLDAEPLDVIISAEHFSSRLTQAWQIEKLKAAFGDRLVTIVCYVRRQDAMALSAYSTAVKAGERRRFDTNDINPSNPYFDYSSTLSRWAEVFGDDAILVRKYQRDSLVGGDICEDFMSLLGQFSLAGWARVPDVNKSMDSLQSAALRRINRFLPRHDECPHWVYEAVMNFRMWLVLPLLPKGRPLAWLLKETTPDEVVKRFASTNAEMERRFMTPGALADWLPPHGSCLPPGESPQTDLASPQHGQGHTNLRPK